MVSRLNIYNIHFLYQTDTSEGQVNITDFSSSPKYFTFDTENKNIHFLDRWSAHELPSQRQIIHW